MINEKSKIQKIKTILLRSIFLTHQIHCLIVRIFFYSISQVPVNIYLISLYIEKFNIHVCTAHLCQYGLSVGFNLHVSRSQTTFNILNVIVNCFYQLRFIRYAWKLLNFVESLNSFQSIIQSTEYYIVVTKNKYFQKYGLSMLTRGFIGQVRAMQVPVNRILCIDFQFNKK